MVFTINCYFFEYYGDYLRMYYFLKMFMCRILLFIENVPFRICLRADLVKFDFTAFNNSIAVNIALSLRWCKSMLKR